jgi:hypothetical protein
MLLLVLCPTCKTENRVPTVLIGKRARCTQCQAFMLVPADAPRVEQARLDEARAAAAVPPPEPPPARTPAPPVGAPRPVQPVAVMARPAPLPTPVAAAAPPPKVADEFDPIYCWVRVTHDPDFKVHGELVATLNPEGMRLHCDDGTGREYFVPRGSKARHAKGAYLYVPLGRRDISLVVEDPNYACKRLARDTADFLRGRLERLSVRDYAAPRPAVWPIVFYPAPLLVPLVGAALWLGGGFGVAVWSALGLLLTLISLIFAVADRWGIIRRLLMPAVLTFVGFVAMGLLYGAGLVLGSAFDPSPRWEKYTSPDGKWAIQMPRKPKVGKQPIPGGGGQPSADKFEAILPFAKGEFVVLSTSLVGVQPMTEEARLDGAKQGVLNSEPGVKLLKEKNLMLHGRYRGREFWFDHPRAGRTCMRFYIVGTDVYGLCVVSRTLPESDFYKFLDSFEILAAQQAAGNPPPPGGNPGGNPPGGGNPGGNPPPGGEPQPKGKQDGGKVKEAVKPPDDPVLTSPDQRGAPPWTPAAPKLDFTPPAASKFDGLIGYWPLDEGKGTVAANNGGKGAAAKVVGGWWINGVRGKAVLFDGKADYINLGDAAALNLGDRTAFTLSLWVAAKDPNGTVFAMRNYGDGGPVLNLSVQNGALYLVLRSDGPESNELRGNGKFIQDSQWHHIGLVREAGGIYTLYIDGKQFNQLAGGRADGPFTTNLRTLGCERYQVLKGFGQASYFNGAVDEVAIFGRALAESELKELAGRR